MNGMENTSHHTGTISTAIRMLSSLMFIRTMIAMEIRKGIVEPPMYPIANPHVLTSSIRSGFVTSVRKES